MIAAREPRIVIGSSAVPDADATRRVVELVLAVGDRDDGAGLGRGQRGADLVDGVDDDLAVDRGEERLGRSAGRHRADRLLRRRHVGIAVDGELRIDADLVTGNVGADTDTMFAGIQRQREAERRLGPLALVLTVEHELGARRTRDVDLELERRGQRPRRRGSTAARPAAPRQLTRKKGRRAWRSRWRSGGGGGAPA